MSSTLIHTKDSTDEADAVESGRLMAEFSIAHQGRYYHYDGYRYERLADAVAYAQLVRARQTQQTDQSSLVKFAAAQSPNASDRQLMLELSISFENGTFVFEGYRYERLIDAANYARHCRQLSLKTL
jgi:hypothetical protein